MLTFTIRSTLFLALMIPLYATQDTTCKKCHPIIYEEYQHAMHAKASIYKDPIHRAVWDKHPAKKKGGYRCASCHTPADKKLLEHGGLPTPNSIQRNEPISCQTCHTITSVETHAKANKNRYTTKERYFFSADKQRKGQKILFKEEKQWFGLITKTVGSPYHDIDYSNESYYNGDMCLGCHDHKENAKGFAICNLEVKPTRTKNCISCHMPQVKGALANQKQTATHAFHGISIHDSTALQHADAITFSLHRETQGFQITLKNHANHTLFAHPLRQGVLQITIERQGRTITLPEKIFARHIGTDNHPSPPWLATQVLSDTTIKAYETRTWHIDSVLQRGDIVTLSLGYYLITPQTAQKLQLKDSEATRLRPLHKQRFTIGE